MRHNGDMCLQLTNSPTSNPLRVAASSNTPLHWLGISKRALHWSHIPSNFHPWALAILEHFDLERYQAAYHMPPEEYEAVARDLPVVLEGLRNYPHQNFAPPIDETSWGFRDQ